MALGPRTRIEWPCASAQKAVALGPRTRIEWPCAATSNGLVPPFESLPEKSRGPWATHLPHANYPEKPRASHLRGLVLNHLRDLVLMPVIFVQVNRDGVAPIGRGPQWKQAGMIAADPMTQSTHPSLAAAVISDPPNRSGTPWRHSLVRPRETSASPTEPHRGDHSVYARGPAAAQAPVLLASPCHTVLLTEVILYCALPCTAMLCYTRMGAAILCHAVPFSTGPCYTVLYPPMLRSATLHCYDTCCAIMYCAVLCRAMLCDAAISAAILCPTLLYSAVFCHAIPRSDVPCCALLCCALLYCAVPCYAVLNLCHCCLCRC